MLKVMKEVYTNVINKWFFVSVVLYLLTVAITLILAIKDDLPIYGAIDIFYYGYIYGNAILNAVFPVFPIIAFHNLFERTTKMQHGALLSCGLLAICCVIYLLVTTIVPLIVLYIVLPHSAMLFSRGTIYNHFQNQTWVYMIIQYLLNTLLLLIAYSTLPMAVCWRKKKDYYVWISILFYNAILYNPIDFHNSFFTWSIPSYSYDVVMIQKPPGPHLMSILAVFVTSGLIYVYKVKKEV